MRERGWWRWKSSSAATSGAKNDYGCDPGFSAASNLGPDNPVLVQDIKQRQQQIAAFDHVKISQIPPDAVTTSASGLDPYISPQNAAIQVDRVAAARHISPAAVRALVAAVDKYIVENEPWALGEKQDEDSRSRLATVLYTAAEALRIATALAYPVMPEATAKIWGQMGLGDIQKLPLGGLAWGQLPLGTKLGEVQPVFPRADKSAIERMQKMEEEQRATPVIEAAAATTVTPGPSSGAPAAPAAAPAVTPPTNDKISIDDFSKIELRVGLVKVAERVPKADKLLRLEIDIGTEVRQVLAGIAEAYAPETLIGRKVVIVANLAPRKLRGMESNGMIVAASLEGGRPVLAGFLEDVPVGARLK